LHHDNGDHFAAAHWMTTGRFGSTSVSQAQKFPSVGSCVAKVRGPVNPRLPAYVGLPSAATVYLFPGYVGAAYLGGAAHAFDLVLGSDAREAFDLDREDPKAADRYGQGPWGRYTLMARRLVEAGVTFVTVDMPHWDDHSSIEKGHGAKVPVVDRAVGALLDDL